MTKIIDFFSLSTWHITLNRHVADSFCVGHQTCTSCKASTFKKGEDDYTYVDFGDSDIYHATDNY